MSPRRRAWLTFAAVTMLVMIAAIALDPWVEQAVERRGHMTHDNDWFRLLRVAGFVPAWIGIALCLALTDLRAKVRGWWDRGALVMLSVLCTALAAELLKLIVRRERPHEAFEDGSFFVFRSFFDSTLSSSGIGMPSSHAAVAFGGAFMLARVAPASRPVVVLWALGCAATRVLSGAHYLSDTVASAVLGYALAWLLWTARHRRAAAPPPVTTA